MDNKNSIFEPSMRRRAQLATLPAELVLCVFDWVCCDEIDLNMLGVSHQIRLILISHPIIQTLGAFQIQTSKDAIKLISDDNDVKQRGQPLTVGVLPRGPHPSIQDIVKRPWCHNVYVTQIQRALLRTMVKAYWTPYLKRDGRLKTPSDLEDIMNRVTTICREAEQGPRGMLTVFDTTTEYSWTRIQIWPLDGRVLIRDQVSNTSKELHVAIISQIELARLSDH